MSKKRSAGKKTKRPKIKPLRKDTIMKEAYEKIGIYSRKRLGLKKQSAELKSWLKKQEDVESVSVYDDANITIKFKDGSRVGVLLNRKKLYGGGAGGDEKLVLYSCVSPKKADDPHPVAKKAAIIDTLYDDWPPKSTPNTINNLLKGAGYEVDYIKSDQANLSFFAKLDDKEYGVVFIRSHGGMMNVAGDNRLQLMVRPFFSSLPPSSGYTGVEVMAVGTDVLPQGWGYVYSINNRFVETYMNNRYFSNSLFHLLVCHGADPLAQNDIIKSLLDRGVGCYTGWTKNASATYGDPAAIQFFKVLCQSSANPTNTVTNAINQITSSGRSPDPQTTAVLVAHGSNAMQIINCFVIDEVSHITVQDKSGKTIRKGFHDILDATQYASNQILGGKHSKLKIVQTVKLQKVQW